ncbi:hypothetical protein, partial [Anaerotruncus colihominis]|uniref:hypothetical protein n=1 Tax=Anaerotruncus colihominis TaxID=169435 RepID=UPI002941F426
MGGNFFVRQYKKIAAKPWRLARFFNTEGRKKTCSGGAPGNAEWVLWSKQGDFNLCVRYLVAYGFHKDI